jgi:hypothetical protein
MISRVQKLKAIVKGTPPQSKFGTDPRDPWSAKANMSEDAALDKYLLSRGINPQFATKDQKVAHSKTGAFINWKKNRMMEETLDEKVDKKDTVTLDIPLLIRVLELAREDIKTDMDLHRVVEKLINIRNKGMLTMKDYNYISKIHEDIMSQVSPEVIEEAKKDPCWTGYQMVGMKKKGGRPVPNCVPEESEVKENHVAIAMGQMLDDESSMVLNQLDDIDRCSKMIRDYIGKDYEKQLPAWVQSKVTLAADYINTVGTYLSSKNEEVEPIDEISKELTHAYFKKSINDKTKDKRKQRMSGQGRAIKRLTNKLTLPDTVAKDYAKNKPGQYVGDSVEHDDTPIVEAQSAALRFQKALQREKAKREEQERKDKESKARAEKLLNPPKPIGESKVSEYSKSARIIKSMYKKKGVTEELYDHEKEDKSVATYGKKPKVVTNDPKDSFGENKPDAAAVLKGGTTLTGQKRDTVEIDPMMRKRPGSDPTGKNK